MSGPRRSTVFSEVRSPKKGFQRQSSFQLNTDSVFLNANTLQQKKNGGKSSTKAMYTQYTKREPSLHRKEKPVYDEEATKKFQSMLRGDLTDLPPLPKTMVKIFLSSTFSDMRAERNTLAKEVYPRLQSFCASRDLDFQVVDMRWGVTEDSINDHSVENLCLLEIENCQKSSVGPNFVVLTGDRYGFRPIPVNLNVDTFEVLQYEVNKLKLPSRELLEEWYKLDENAVPATYVLQPIRSKFTFFGDFSPGCDELRIRDTTEWWKTFEKLQILLKKAADAAFDENKLTADERHKFFLSVTESEIQDGILKATDTDMHCLVYKRRLRHLCGVGLNDRDTPRYIDVIKSDKGNMLDEEVERLKVSLFEEKIKGKLDSSNIKEYSVHWMPGGVNPDVVDDHRDYLSSFCRDFIADCKRLIKKAEAEKKKKLIPLSNYYSDYNNTIHHLRFCVSKCENFCGQEQVLAAVKDYIMDKSGRKPLVLYASSGVGKTSVMAMVMKSIPEWLNNAPHLRLIRFLGTSPQSNNVFDVLVDVLRHLSDVYDMIMSPPNYKTMKKVVEFTPRYIRQISHCAKEPIIILLDSLDQLYPRNNAYSLDWLPLVLPQNVKLIVSTLPKAHGILANLKKRLPEPKCYIEIPPLTEKTAKQIMETNLQANNRSLTASQMSFIWSNFKQAQSPLYLKLLLDEARKWKSYTQADECEVVSSVHEAIRNLFRNLEKKFGSVLVSHALGFITVGLSGLTEFEIDDALSCDDQCLNEVYRYHDPPVPGIVQIPPLLWARIWYDIRGYLVDRMSYGKRTLNWYHREFVNAATEMYVTEDKGELYHQILYEIYYQENGIKRTIILDNRNQLVIIDADRQVTPQPYTADNKRRLACLPYHTLRAHNRIGIEEAKANVYCNFKYLYTRIIAFSISAAANDLSDFVEESKDEEARILLDFLVNCKQDLTNQIRFAFCLVAYINPTNNHYQLKTLQNEATEFLRSKKKPILIPEFPCLAQRHDVSNAFDTSIQGVSGILANSNSYILLQKSKDIDERPDSETEKSKEAPDLVLWSIETQEELKVLAKDGAKQIRSYILGDEFLYYLTNNAFVRYNVKNGHLDTMQFRDVVTEWNASACVNNLFSNSDASVGALVQDSSFNLISLEKVEHLQECLVSDKKFKIDRVFVLSSGQKVVAVGKTHTSPGESQQLSSECRSFVSTFEQGKPHPTEVIEIDKHLNCQNAVLSGKDRWLVIPAETALVKAQNEKQVASNQLDICGHLLAFDVSDSIISSTEIEIPSAINKVSIHPEKRKLIVLTNNRKVYCILAAELSAKTINIEIQLNFAVTMFDVSWEDEFGLFCSNGGKIALYDLKSEKTLLVFAAHSDRIKDMCLTDQQLITIGEDNEMKTWVVKSIFQNTRLDVEDVQSSDMQEKLLEQINVVSLSLSYNGEKLLTNHDDGKVKTWCAESKAFLREYNIGIAADIVHTFPHGSVVFHDTKAGQMRIIALNTGLELFHLPDTMENIFHSTSDEKDKVYTISSNKSRKQQIDIISIDLERVVKTIHLQTGLSFEKIEAVLSCSRRYLVFRILMPEKEFEQVKQLYRQSFPWKKGGFSEQHHPYRFTAVAISEGSGALIPCHRIAEKVPTVGILLLPYRGNIMLISTRRWIVFWDIPTGKCDRKPSKLRKVSMFFRPAWLEKECFGATRTCVQSANQKIIACGSDDGYMFVYDSDTGLPVGNRKPLTKHNAEVSHIAISKDSRWIASSCRNSILKLWESCTGVEQFSVRLDAEVKGMMFSPNSRTLVLFTGRNKTRMFMFDVTSGK